MTYFPDKTLEVYSLTESTGIYGETIKVYNYAGDLLVDFQNSNNNEIAQSYGVELQNLYKIYFNEEENIDDTALLKDEEYSYHIVGQIMKYTKFHHYQKAYIVKERR